MFTKAKIFNLTLGALLLTRQIIDTDSDASNEAKALNLYYDIALGAALEDMDLDSTATQETLALVEEDPNDLWAYSYEYPSNCAFFRRIVSPERIDNRETWIDKEVRMVDEQTVILTDEETAIGEYIANDFPLAQLKNANAGLAIAYRLAVMAGPLVVGKGFVKLVPDLEKKYLIAKAEAQEKDRLENFNFTPEDIASEFVGARTS